MENQGKKRKWNPAVKAGLSVLAGEACLVAAYSLAYLIDYYPEKFVFSSALVCLMGFCAFTVGHYAEISTRPTGESATYAEPKPSVRRLVIDHSAPVIVLVLIMWFFVPEFAKVFMDSLGPTFPLPVLTQVVLDISRWIIYHFLLFLPLASTLLWYDVRVYMWLHRHGKQSWARVWLYGIFGCLFALIPLVIMACFLPVIKMDCLWY